ncbi:MAG TPA: phage tail protein [Longimicrobium sp.]|jgi:phage tail-like protein|nr:phage tail protein [Longimicrobium sp.]
MAGEVQDAVWPLPKFYFTVTLGDDTSISFQEVDGLDSETQVIEYRHGNSPIFYPIKMPGLGKVGNVTLRKGIFVNDAKFWTWYNEIKLNTVARRTVTIALLDETATPKMTWTLNNAWPTKITGTDLKSEGNEVAVESIEVAYETLVVAAP